MEGNNFKKKVVPLIFTQFWIISHLNKLDRLTPQDIYRATLFMSKPAKGDRGIEELLSDKYCAFGSSVFSFTSVLFWKEHMTSFCIPLLTEPPKVFQFCMMKFWKHSLSVGILISIDLEVNSIELFKLSVHKWIWIFGHVCSRSMKFAN